MPKDMPKQHFLQLLPKLRFPEFNNAPAWEEKRLGEVCDFLKGKGLPKSAIIFNGIKPCIHYGELFTRYSEVIKEIKSYTNLETNCILSNENDVLMPTSDVTPNGLAKSCCIKIDNVILGGDILIIRTDKCIINGEFLARIIRFLERKVLQLVSGSTVFHLYASQLKSLQVFIPSLAEQQKIADCLSSLDGVIALEGQKLVALKDHKKGLMQNLFPSLDCSILDCSILDCPQDGNPQEGNPQEGKGKAIPNFRFPEFNNAPAWEIKKLGEVLSYEQPTKYLVKDSKYNDEYKTPVLTAGKTFLLGHTNETSGIFKDNLPTIIFDDFTTAFQFVDFHFKAKSSAMKMLVPATKDINMKFVFEAMKTIKFFPEAHKRYWISEYQNKTIPYPSLPEQQKIADCLSSLDGLITAQAQKIISLKDHKKGLMQNLFPASSNASSNATEDCPNP